MPDRQIAILSDHYPDGFLVPSPFTAGHVLTEGEANALNQTYAENIRNNIAARVNKEISKNAKPSAETVQSMIYDYCATYEFGVRQESSKLDPVGAQALTLAKEQVRKKLKEKNQTVDKETLEKLAASVVEKYPAFRERAKAILAEKKAAREALASEEFV